MHPNEAIESGPYPERPEEPDCAYYIRTGLCRFGMTCRFNHPPNRMLVNTSPYLFNLIALPSVGWLIFLLVISVP